MATMAQDPSFMLGLREGVTTIQERLDGSFRGKCYDILSRATPISGDYDKSSGRPVRTIINRSWMTADKITPVAEKDFNSRILNYQKAGFTSEAHDDMVAGRHYVDTKYEATVAKPEVLVDHAWFNNLQALQNSFNLQGDKQEKMAINILTAKNVMWLKALTAPQVLRATRNEESDLSTMLVDLPASRYHVADTKETDETLSFREIALLNARTKNMNGTRKLLAMNPIQHALFYDVNKNWLKNNDYVPGSDLTALDTIKPFQGGIVPFQIEEISDADNNVLFGLDESQMILFNEMCVSKVLWGGLEADCEVDGRTYGQVQCWRKETLSYVRTSDLGVMIIKIPGLIPTLSVKSGSTEATTLTPAKGASSVTLTVQTNDKRMTAQPWTAVTDADWVTLTPKTASGSGQLKVEYAANTTGTQRSATIEIVSAVPGYEGDASLRKVISVTQAGA